MNAPLITPPDLSTPPYKDLVEHLALRWVAAELPAPISYLYLDFLNVIGNLLLSTQSSQRTEAIVTAVLNQAVAFGKNSYWVEQELTFEGIVDGADRRDYLRLDLERAAQSLDGEVNDENLDRYNQRLKRFSNDNP